MNTFSFGWWTTGRDKAAVELFRTVIYAIKDGAIPGKLSYLFCSRERGDSPYADEIMALAETHRIPVICKSALNFEPDLREKDMEKWRSMYHREVLDLTKDYPSEIVMLAGYMWVVSPEACSILTIINLHPALPGGPAGTWQEVIWQLLESEKRETGVMIHLVTPELDQGPPLTFCRFPIKGKRWDDLREEFKREKGAKGLDAIKAVSGEAQPLFAEIRKEGVMRELPLIVQTLRSLAIGEIRIKDRKLFDPEGKELKGPYDLSGNVEASFKKGAMDG